MKKVKVIERKFDQELIDLRSQILNVVQVLNDNFE